MPVYHRTSDAQCEAAAPAGNCSVSGGSPPPGSCSDGSACSDAGANGRCVVDGPLPGCHCTYDACASDTDCPSGQTCACHGSAFTGGQGNTCVPGNCRVDTDCGAGNYCSPSIGANSCGGIGGYYCHTAKDSCVNDTDCSNPSGGAQVCTYSTSDARWECTAELFCG